MQRAKIEVVHVPLVDIVNQANSRTTTRNTEEVVSPVPAQDNEDDAESLYERPQEITLFEAERA